MTYRFEVGERIRVKATGPRGIAGRPGHVTHVGSATQYYKISLDDGRKKLIVNEDDLELFTPDGQFHDQPANLLDHW